jgi:hypothetical protein
MQNGPRGTRFASKDSGGKTNIQRRSIEEWSRFASDAERLRRDPLRHLRMPRSSNQEIFGLYVPFAVTV